MIGGIVGGLIMALVTTFKMEWSPITRAPFMRLLEGLALGGISSNARWIAYHGIAIQAVALTFATTAVMLVAYSTGLIRATRKFTIGRDRGDWRDLSGVLGGYGAEHFSAGMYPLINDAGPVGIAISVVIVIVAALNLILDFNLIETGVQAGAAKYMEWYGAFAPDGHAGLAVSRDYPLAGQNAPTLAHPRLAGNGSGNSHRFVSLRGFIVRGRCLVCGSQEVFLLSSSSLSRSHCLSIPRMKIRRSASVSVSSGPTCIVLLKSTFNRMW